MRKKNVGNGSTTLGGLVARGLLIVSLTVSGGCGEGTTRHEESPGEGHGRQAILDQARQRGALFRGAGNEPGWNVEVGPVRTTLVTRYGEERHEFATPSPVVDETGRRTTYATRFDGHEIVVEWTIETCSDTMSDETFPASVRVVLDGRELLGCGVVLSGS